MVNKLNYKQTELGEIPEGWKGYPFPEVIDFQEGPGILAKDFRDNGTPLVRLAGLNKSASLFEGCNYLDPKLVEQRYSHFKIKKGDILLSTSASLGRTAVVGEKSEGAIVYTGIIRMRPLNKILFAPFIKYLLEAPDFQKQVEVMGVGSVIRHFGPWHLKQMTVVIPPIQEQRAITKILSDLDEKIELNRQMNKTLESIAQAIFKQWFMEFEFPGENGKSYKSSGGKMVDSELGEIPEGWQFDELGNFAEILNGFAFKSEDFVSTGVFLLRTRNFTEDGYIMRDDTACLPENFYDEYKSFRLKKLDVLLVMVGASVGKMAIVQSSVLPALQNQNMWNFRSKSGSGQLFLNFLVKKIVQENMGTASGSARDFFRKDYFRNINFILPSGSVLKDFDKQVCSIFNCIDKNLTEIQILAQIRDSLLSRLMLGKIRVNCNKNGGRL